MDGSVSIGSTAARFEPSWPSEYAAASPFPHIVIDNLLSRELCAKLFAEFDSVAWQGYRHYNEDKEGTNRGFPPLVESVIRDLNSPAFLRYLEELTGISGLIADETMGSGGIHQSKQGGFLNIHADFTVHPYRREWHRRLNVLIYLNDNWKPEWGGELELWSSDMSRCIRKITPAAGRCVVFNTAKDSFHGHPEPMQCPEGVWRRSIAMYYYTSDRVEALATEYRARPTDGLRKRALMFADELLLRAFHKAKRLAGVHDNTITWLMGRSKRE